MADIVAHRGASALAPENTLEAFELAITLGVGIIELDVLATADGVLVVHHDFSREGITIADISYAELVNKPAFRSVPTLEAVLMLVADRAKLYVEIKEPGYEREVVDTVLKYINIDDFSIISFQDEAIAAVKQYRPDITCGLLLVERLNGELVVRRKDVFPIPRFRACKADFLAPRCIPHLTVTVFQAQLHNIPLYMWTVNRPLQYRLLSKVKNVETIASDMPSEMMPKELKKSLFAQLIRLPEFIK
jgi:glycerophosphoryl diester phosphodiesterase